MPQLNTTIAIAFLLFCSVPCMAKNKKLAEAKKIFSKNFYSGKLGIKKFNETFHFLNISGIICVDVTISGKVYTFIYDSGALTLASTEIIKEYSLKIVGRNPVVDADNKEQTLDVYQLPTMSINNVPFGDIGCLSYDFTEISKRLCRKIDGILGANAMRLCYWTINMKDTTLNLSSSLGSLLPQVQVLPFQERIDGGVPRLNLHIGDTIVSAAFDCGNTNFIQINDSVFSKIKNRSIREKAIGTGYLALVGFGTVNGTKYRFRQDSLSIDNLQYQNEIIDVEPGQILIGTAFLKNKVATLDWKTHKIYLQSTGKPISPEDFGFTLGVVEQKLAVNFLWKGSPADLADIALGDIITSLNGKSVIANDICEAKELTMEDTIDVSFVHQGNEPKTVHLIKKKLFN